MAPWLTGLAPYGFVIGVSAAQAHLPALTGWLTGPVIFSGSAQVASIRLLDGGAAPVVALVAVLAVNLRLVVYSAAMVRHWRGTSRWWQAAAAYALVDPTVAVGVDGYERATDPRQGHLHYAGGAVTLWVAWVTAIALGIAVGGGLPHWLRLDLVAPLFLIGEVARRTTGPVATKVVAMTAVLAVAGTVMPQRLGVLVAIVGGTLLAARLEARS
jgi:predicted branched-subunit amino acid permease